MHRTNFIPILLIFFLQYLFLMLHVCSRNNDAALSMSISMIRFWCLLFYTFFFWIFFLQYFVHFFFEGNILYTYLILKKCIAPISCLFFYNISYTFFTFSFDNIFYTYLIRLQTEYPNFHANSATLISI